MSKPKVLLQVTGSIAAFKAAALASKLAQDDYEVQSILSDGARHFVGEATFEGLTGRPVLGDMFERAVERFALDGRRRLAVLQPSSLSGQSEREAHMIAVAQAAGLEVMAWAADISPAGITLAREVPFTLDPPA